MVINLDDCNACIRVVGDVSELLYHGELLEFSLTTETVTGPFLARLQSLHGKVPWADRPSVSQAVVSMDDYDRRSERLRAARLRRSVWCEQSATPPCSHAMP